MKKLVHSKLMSLPFNDMSIKIAIASFASLVATVCFGQDFYLTCEGDRSTVIEDRDSENRSELLLVQRIPPRRVTETFIVRGGKVFTPDSAVEVKNCEISQYLIKCSRPLEETIKGKKGWLSYSELEINRISGSIKETFGTHTYGGMVSGRKAVQISTTYFDGNCKNTSQSAF